MSAYRMAASKKAAGVNQSSEGSETAKAKASIAKQWRKIESGKISNGGRQQRKAWRKSA